MLFTRRFRLALFVLSLPAFAATAPGIKNFDQVDAHVYRGGQPTNEGFQYLSKLGVKTVIDLREGGSRAQAEAGFAAENERGLLPGDPARGARARPP